MAIIQSGNGSDLLNIDSVSKAARASLYQNDGVLLTKRLNHTAGSNTEFLPVSILNDTQVKPLRGDRFGSVSVATNTLLFAEAFEGATIHASRLVVATTTFVNAQTTALGFNFNSTNLSTAAAATLLRTARSFARFQRAPLHLKFRARMGHVTGAVFELGLGNTTTQTATSTTGVYFQITAGGVVQGVLSNQGVEITSALTMPVGWQNNYYVWDILMDDDSVTFIVQDTTAQEIIASTSINIPNTQARFYDSTRLPVIARLHNTVLTSGFPIFVLSQIGVVSIDTDMNYPASHNLSLAGYTGYEHPATGAQSINQANSTAPASGTLSNTTAAYTTAGGLFQFVAVAGAATDYLLFAYASPAPFTFICTGIDIDAWNTGAAVATTPTLMYWFAAPDMITANLTTASTRRLSLGSQSFPVGSAIGARADRAISIDFSHAPLVTNPGRSIGIGLRMPIATATASQIIQGMVTLKGYYV